MGSAVTDERQGNPRNRQQPEGDTGIEGDVLEKQKGDARREQRTESVPRFKTQL